MKTLTVLSRKGGTGYRGGTCGYKVAIVDLDSQTSASEWSNWREAETPEVVSVHSAHLPQELHRLEQQGITFVILDTPPKIENIALDAAKVADLAIIPCKPPAFDLKAIEKTILVGNMAKCPMRIVFNAVCARSSMPHPAKRAVQVYDVDVRPVLSVIGLSFHIR